MVVAKIEKMAKDLNFGICDKSSIVTSCGSDMFTGINSVFS